jgi:4-amino-4-deoxy-L-arabinose transferase-like glycosyltransferase
MPNLRRLITKNFNVNLLFYALIITMTIWHIWSLAYSPLPWFDETFFASITHSLMNGHGFHLAICPIQTNGEQVLTYGPIYFLLTTISSTIFGFGLISFRIVNLLGAIISIIVFYKILQKLQLPFWIIVGVSFLLVFDVIFIQNAHSGRMDLVALAFFLSAISIHLGKQKHIITPLLIGFLGTLAVLTTLRIAVFVMPFFVTLFLYNLIKRNWLYSITLLTSSIVLYGIWVWWGFGSIENYISEYLGKNNGADNSLISSFVGGNLKIPIYQLPLVVIGSISFLIWIFKSYRVLNTWLLLMPIAFFYLLVKDTGAYSAMVVPFWYLAIANATFLLLHRYAQKKRIEYTIYATTAFLLLINTGVFALKAITIVSTMAERDPKPLNHWVKKHLPKDSRVVGDDRYYYACLQNNSDFQYMDRVANHSTRARYHAEEYQPNYLFISTQTPQVILNAYKAEFNFEEQWNYIPSNTNHTIQKLISLLPIPIQSSYEGTLIKVSSKQVKRN